MPEAPTFEDFALNRQVLNAVAEASYETPTAIQQQAMPQVLADRSIAVS